MVITRLSVDGRAARIAAGGQQGAATTPAEPTLWAPGPVGAHHVHSPLPKAARPAVGWNFKVPGGPGNGHRMTMRWADTLYQPTQWFPRVAVYDDLRGWDPELYLGPSEFYNGFGRYDVRIDVPAGWVVSGTGVLQNPQEVLTPVARERLARVLDSDAVTTIVGPNDVGPGVATAAGDRLVWHLVAEQVNDFAWATAKQFVWQATRATIPGKGPVPIHMVFYPAAICSPSRPDQRHALEFYSALGPTRSAAHAPGVTLAWSIRW
jgi:hypothetical protein